PEGALLHYLPQFLPDPAEAVQLLSPGCAAHSNAMVAGSMSYRRDANRHAAGSADLQSLA
ncbi:MAG: hypothetical protein WA750_05875, partial [Pseudolabrys sp.]